MKNICVDLFEESRLDSECLADSKSVKEDKIQKSEILEADLFYEDLDGEIMIITEDSDVEECLQCLLEVGKESLKLFIISDSSNNSMLLDLIKNGGDQTTSSVSNSSQNSKMRSRKG